MEWLMEWFDRNVYLDLIETSDIISFLSFLGSLGVSLVAITLSLRNTKTKGVVGYCIKDVELKNFKKRKYTLPHITFTNKSSFPVYIQELKVIYELYYTYNDFKKEKVFFREKSSFIRNYLKYLKVKRNSQLTVFDEEATNEEEYKSDCVLPNQQVSYCRFHRMTIPYSKIAEGIIEYKYYKKFNRDGFYVEWDSEVLKNFSNQEREKLLKKHREELVEIKLVSIKLTNGKTFKMKKKALKLFGETYIYKSVKINHDKKMYKRAKSIDKWEE